MKTFIFIYLVCYFYVYRTLEDEYIIASYLQTLSILTQLYDRRIATRLVKFGLSLGKSSDHHQVAASPSLDNKAGPLRPKHLTHTNSF